MRTYVTILSGPTAAKARPVCSSSDPEVVDAAFAAIQRRLGQATPGPGQSMPAERPTTSSPVPS
jgi:hypothetical protein